MDSQEKFTKQVELLSDFNTLEHERVGAHDGILDIISNCNINTSNEKETKEMLLKIAQTLYTDSKLKNHRSTNKTKLILEHV